MSDQEPDIPALEQRFREDKVSTGLGEPCPACSHPGNVPWQRNVYHPAGHECRVVSSAALEPSTVVRSSPTQDISRH